MNNDWFEAGHAAIVTGGSQGLGKALVTELLRRGLNVVTDARDARALAEAEREFRTHPGRVITKAGDVTDPEHAHALVNAAKREFGRLDLLVNNASTLGETPLQPLTELSRPTFDRVFATNLFAPLHLMQHALPLLAAQPLGTIVNVTSDAAVQAYPNWGAYGSSKAALEHLSRIFAEELEGGNVRVLVVDPGDMNTAMHRAAIPDADPATLADPADVAKHILHAIATMDARFARTAISLAEARA